ncbi:LysE family translocator [Amphritea sp. 2_MG-2023]|uniref:LysE family translocator n=1 Tax=Amphritea TaxID=515417 RepID=UPI001C07D9F7|nr:MULTISPECIES: LysE family translocator [Amphritea]MBU2966790.1 LysE family translocator [Amphritea atlantica]MDO6420679.1 LysE family translocator [Amphritea sp. 2_MG-2023]MDX2422321.1 LysE family translocator [Amphritea sp.]
MSVTLLSLFIPTFFFVSITPGMCMTLALSLGMSIGVRRSLHMMWGELIGVGLVAAAAAAGVAALMLQFPEAFIFLKLGGGAYLGWLGFQMWQSKGKLVMQEPGAEIKQQGKLQLALNGFITAIANPKGWAFFVTLLPPFLDQSQPLAPQLALLIAVILSLEFSCLLIYASGGKAMRHLLLNRNNVKLMNRIAGSLMIAVGVWLAFG